MKKLAILTVGLQFGDEGKGSCVEHLCRHYGPELVVRYSGGSQCGHNVVSPDGKTHHTFAQWGSGTLLGIPTYLGPAVVIHPGAMVQEARCLEARGIRAFQLLHVDPRCLVSTSYHRTLNRVREIARGGARHGSCGHGIGEVRRYWLKHGQDAITADDLRPPDTLRPKLELLRQRTLAELGHWWRDDMPIDPGLPTAEEESAALLDVGRILYVTQPDWQPETTIFEGAQGVLLDERHGFHPHTTWSTVTPYHALAMLGNADRCYTLGIARCFTVRHGPGPLPTEDEALIGHRGRPLSDPNNPPNEWQGPLRFGHLDIPLLRYAVSCLGTRLDGIALNHLDRDPTKMAVAYEDNPLVPSALPTLARQARMGNLLRRARPVYEHTYVHDILKAVEEIAPVVIRGYGPTHGEKRGDLGL